MGTPIVSIRDRLLRSVAIQGECWIWQLARLPKGYGLIGVKGKNQLAHRVSYETFVGAIPEGLTLDHLCRNTSCVNPAHLEPVTAKENLLRGNSPAAMQARQTHCKRGHELAGENLYAYKGRRFCRLCRSAYGEAYREAHRA